MIAGSLAATWLKLTVEIVKRPSDQHTFQALPRRWVVERTLAWITSSAAAPATTNASPPPVKLLSTGP